MAARQSPTPVETGEGEERPSLPPWPIRGRALLEIAAAYEGLVFLGLIIGWLLLGPLASSGFALTDDTVARWWEGLRAQQWDELTDLGSAFSDTTTMIMALVVLMGSFVWWWRRWREALTLGLALLLEASVFLTVSLTVGRDRPPVEQLDVSPPTASFPSGHTGAAFAFYTTLAVIVFWRTSRPLPRALAVAGAAVVPPIVAVSRMYRGMHFLSDILVGALLGVGCVLISIAIVRRALRRQGSEVE